MDVIGCARVSTWHLPSLLLASLCIHTIIKVDYNNLSQFYLITSHLMKIKESQVRLIHYVKSLFYTHAACLCQHKP